MVLDVSRPPSPAKFFESWAAYLGDVDCWGGGGEPSLCRALAVNSSGVRRQRLEHINIRIAELYSQNLQKQAEILEQRAEAEADQDDFAGLPWITPILGSGCQNAAEGPSRLEIVRVPAQVAAALPSGFLLPDGTPGQDAVQRFAQHLLDSKLGQRLPGKSGRQQGAAPVDRTVTAHALLCALLLTRLYHTAGALLEKPLGDPSTPIALHIDLDGPIPSGAEVHDALVVPLLTQLTALKTAVAKRPRPDVEFVSTFADLVRTDLTASPLLVRASDASLMTELAWHFMIESTTQYPGWSELLVLLSIAFNSQDRRARWPYLTDLERARSLLARTLEETTRLSWGSRLDQSVTRPSPRDRLYDTVARLLIAQAALANPEKGHHSDALPSAVAFVTSFDLELEMALLAANQPFRLVMPFYTRVYAAASSEHKTTGYVWLQTLITPPSSGSLKEKDIDLVRDPNAWSMLSTRPDLEDEMAGVPAVVRLAGCPLVQGPDLKTANGTWADKLRAQLRQGREEQSPGNCTLVAGTVMLDEYTALHQWAADLGVPNNAKDVRDRLGLPERFVRGTEDGNVMRFWFLLGVQLGDDAVRQRVAAIVGAADLRGGDDIGRLKPKRAGVVVNRRSTPAQRDVFLWQGLDVVSADYDDVMPAIDHAAMHAANVGARRRVEDPCSLPGDPK